MVLVPGAENPRDGIDSKIHSLGIRLTRRNTATPDIQKLKAQIYHLETKAVIGTRKRTSSSASSFGSRNYQPHIQLLRPWHKIDDTLTEIGNLFRNSVDEIEFDGFQIEARHWFSRKRCNSASLGRRSSNSCKLEIGASGS